MFAIVGRLFPEAIITDRSARTGGATDGVLYVAHTRRPRHLELPGLTVRARTGAGPQPGDVAYPGGLYLASKPRALAENCAPSRARSGQRRTLDEEELGDWIEFLAQNEGVVRLTTWRRQAEQMAATLGVKPEHLARMQRLVGIALGTRPDESTPSSSLAARRSGTPVDQRRVGLFERLAKALRAAAPQSRPLHAVSARYAYLPFYEAYFSNFIEGTEFGVDEAARIVFDAEIPTNRAEDAHDVIGTYRLVGDLEEMNDVGSSPDEFIHLIKRRNAAIMDGRPGTNPGRFKTVGNRAGATVFVDPELVEGTLRAGFRLREYLATAWETASFHGVFSWIIAPVQRINGKPIHNVTPRIKPSVHSSRSAWLTREATTAARTRQRRSMWARSCATGGWSTGATASTPRSGARPAGATGHRGDGRKLGRESHLSLSQGP